MLARSLCSLAVLVFAGAARGQDVCEADSEARVVFDVGNVRATLRNDGGLFYDGRDALYEVPAGSGSGALFHASLWIGGYVDGELRLAASTYKDFEYRPGPLDAQGRPAVSCAEADRIGYVTHGDLWNAYQGGEAVPPVDAWPTDLGAPYRDRDGRPGYDPAAGDLPLILGDGMAWWVMNDVASPHAENGTPPIGMQVEASAWAFDAPGWIGTTTFFRYVFTYRGSAPLDSAYIALFIDPDLGGAGDDYVGADTTLHLAYAYNGGASDAEYGEHPPALGFAVLDGPEAPAGNGLDDDRDGVVDEPGERLGLGAFINFSGGVQDSPHAPNEYMHAMQARWADGRRVTVGGAGRDFSAEPTRFVFPAEPGTFWSEGDIDGRGTALSPSDRQAMWSVGPFGMRQGQVDTLTFAIVFSRDVEAVVDPHHASVARLKRDVRVLRDSRAVFLQPREDLYARYSLPEPGPEAAAIVRPAPNPTSGIATLRATLPPSARADVEVYDMLGRRVLEARVLPGTDRPVRLDLSALPAGVYVWRVAVEGVGAVASGTLVKL